MKTPDIGETTTGQLPGAVPLWEEGERGALRSIQARLKRGGNGLAILGSGDDAAVWRPLAGQDLVVSQDALVEGQDWIEGWLTPTELGHRALAVAVSDLAAMGATPLYCLATVCVPAGTTADFMDGLLEGLLSAADVFECQLVGGDLSAIDGPIVIDVSVAGSCPQGSAMRRDKGLREDLLAVTGTLGDAAAGLQFLQGRRGSADPRWRERWAQPVPRINEGLVLRDRGVLCAGDISDGLLADAARTGEASGCGAEIWIDRLPVDAHLKEAFPDWLTLATAAGEDFELLFTIAPGRKDALLHDWPDGLAPIHVVGRLTGGSGVSLLKTPGGRAVEPPAITSGHFHA